jgi:hypothetical protein
MKVATMPNQQADQLAKQRFEQQQAALHPDRYVLGKPSPNRAKQFKPFAALRGYEELIEEVMAKANEEHDFTPPEEGG